MNKSKTWVLISDGAHARVFQTDASAKVLSAVPDGTFEADNPPTRDIDADRPGVGFDRAGQGIRRMQTRTDAHSHYEFFSLRNWRSFCSRRKRARPMII
ncbi:MAG: hypothetical protein HOM07_18735 [Rhodospirillaceae bacterium]|nr:hypothetical protein [Rhodospirillaceae bacterium]